PTPRCPRGSSVWAAKSNFHNDVARPFSGPRTAGLKAPALHARESGGSAPSNIDVGDGLQAVPRAGLKTRPYRFTIVRLRSSFRPYTCGRSDKGGPHSGPRSYSFK